MWHPQGQESSEIQYFRHVPARRPLRGGAKCAKVGLESYGNQRFRVVRKAMDLESVKGKLASLLRDKLLGTTADITEHTVVCRGGKQLLGIHLCADHPGFDDIFDIDHEFCGHVHEQLEEWFAHPRFS